MKAKRAINPKILSERTIGKKHFHRYINCLKKHPNSVITFYHGTSKERWQKIQASGYIYPTKNLNFIKKEQQIEYICAYMTTSIPYAFGYAMTAAKCDRSIPVILKIQLPLYFINEVQWYMSNSKTFTNLLDLCCKMSSSTKNIVMNYSASTEQRVDNIIRFFIEQHKLQFKANQFTTSHPIPLRFICSTTLKNSDFLSESIYSIIINNKSKHPRRKIDISEAQYLFDEEELDFPNNKNLPILLKTCTFTNEYYIHRLITFKDDYDKSQERCDNLLDFLTHPEVDSNFYIGNEHSYYYDSKEYVRDLIISELNETSSACSFIKTFLYLKPLQDFIEYVFNDDIHFLYEVLYDKVVRRLLTIVQSTETAILPDDPCGAKELSMVKYVMNEYTNSLIKLTKTTLSDDDIHIINKCIDKRLRESYLMFLLSTIGSTLRFLSDNPDYRSRIDSIIRSRNDLELKNNAYNMPIVEKDEEAKIIIDYVSRCLFVNIASNEIYMYNFNFNFINDEEHDIVNEIYGTPVSIANSNLQILAHRFKQPYGHVVTVEKPENAPEVIRKRRNIIPRLSRYILNPYDFLPYDMEFHASGHI